MIKIFIICEDKRFRNILFKHLSIYMQDRGKKCEITFIDSPELNTRNRRYSHVSTEHEAIDLENVCRVECRKDNCTIYYDHYYEMYNPRTVSRLVEKVKEHDDFVKLNRADYVRKSEIAGFKGNDIVVTKNMTYIKLSPSGADNVSDLVRARH